MARMKDEAWDNINDECGRMNGEFRIHPSAFYILV